MFRKRERKQWSLGRILGLALLVATQVFLFHSAIIVAGHLKIMQPPYATHLSLAIVFFMLIIQAGLACVFQLLMHHHVPWRPNCPRCGYSLVELTGDACPECGTPFDRESNWFRGNFRIDKPHPKIPIRVKRVAIMAAVFWTISVIASAVFSWIHDGCVRTVGWPIPIYSAADQDISTSGLLISAVLADVAVWFLVAVVVEYIVQGLAQWANPYDTGDLSPSRQE
ncbi:MAG: hypothetical protein IT440_03530 [Phycisphaeraceae bacterium]|nr:hypothetical protein [Phycisphaeraceae bacterium]